MTDVQGFGSMDGMLAAMRKFEDIANSRLLPGQARLRDATTERCYFARAMPDYDLVIYGIVPPNAETQEEDGFNVDENRTRGYLTGIAYSTAVGEDGEPGDTHVSQVTPISEETFRLAQRLGFPDWQGIRETDNRDLARRLAQHEQESMS
jgi:hypothetical protein